MEDEDLVVLHCRGCEWEAFFYCQHASPAAIEARAVLHHITCQAGRDGG